MANKKKKQINLGAEVEIISTRVQISPILNDDMVYILIYDSEDRNAEAAYRFQMTYPQAMDFAMGLAEACAAKMAFDGEMDEQGRGRGLQA